MLARAQAAQVFGRQEVDRQRDAVARGLGVEQAPRQGDVDVAARDQQVAGAAPGLVEIGRLVGDGNAELLGERRGHDHQRQAVAGATREGRRRVLRPRRVVLEPQLGVLLQRFGQAELLALQAELVGDVDRQVAAHRVAQREQVVGADGFARRREQAVGEQRIGRRRRRRGGAAGEQGGDEDDGRGKAHGLLPAAAVPPRHAITSQTRTCRSRVFAAAGRSLQAAWRASTWAAMPNVASTVSRKVRSSLRMKRPAWATAKFARPAGSALMRARYAS